MWVLPKGKIEVGETLQGAAIREVNEETGLRVEIIEFINSIEYTYFLKVENMYYRKKVFFYLMKPIGGGFINHDQEFDEVLWVSKQKALKTMTFDSEVEIVKESFLLAKKQSKAG